MLKKHLVLTVGFMFCTAMVNVLMAQGGPPGGGAGGGTPIDGGISLLVAGAAAYGAKKIRDRKKEKADKSI